VTNERLLKIGCGLTLVCGLLLLFPSSGSSQLRAPMPPRFSPAPFLGVPFPPNTQPMLAIGGFSGFGNAMGVQGMQGGGIQGQNMGGTQGGFGIGTGGFQMYSNFNFANGLFPQPQVPPVR
jgi:hypothetical protein